MAQTFRLSLAGLLSVWGYSSGDLPGQDRFDSMSTWMSWMTVKTKTSNAALTWKITSNEVQDAWYNTIQQSKCRRCEEFKRAARLQHTDMPDRPAVVSVNGVASIGPTDELRTKHAQLQKRGLRRQLTAGRIFGSRDRRTLYDGVSMIQITEELASWYLYR